MTKPFDYSKWDKIELSDDESDLHPNIDKDSWFRLKHRTRVERDEDEGKDRAALEKNLNKLKEELKVFGEKGKEHAKAKKLQTEIAAIEKKLEEMEKSKKWNADNMCKTAESRTEVNSAAGRLVPKPEPRLKGEEVAVGYEDFVDKHEALLEEYISLGDEEDLELVEAFLKEHGGTLLQGEHAESYLLLDCLEKEMNGMHSEMVKSARQSQLLVQIREFSRASQRPVRDAVVPIFKKLIDHEETWKSFEETCANYVKRIEVRAVEKKKEMDEEEERGLNPDGPGGLNPVDVLKTLPFEMQEAFRTQDIARLQAAIESLPQDEAKYHLRRCEDSGLWVPNHDAGSPPYRAEDDDDDDDP